MAQDITLLGASYEDVPAVELPKTGGGVASFTDVTDTTAAASDVATGKYFYTAAGVKTEGTASGGGGMGELELLCKITTTEEVTEIVKTLDTSGTFSELYTWVHTVPSPNCVQAPRAIMFGLNASSAFNGWAAHGKVTTNQYQNSVGHIVFTESGALSRVLSSNSAGSVLVTEGSTNQSLLKTDYTSSTTITKLYLSCQNTTGVFGVGTEFFVWGRRS